MTRRYDLVLFLSQEFCGDYSTGYIVGDYRQAIDMDGGRPRLNSKKAVALVRFLDELQGADSPAAGSSGLQDHSSERHEKDSVRSAASARVFPHPGYLLIIYNQVTTVVHLQSSGDTSLRSANSVLFSAKRKQESAVHVNKKRKVTDVSRKKSRI